MIIRKAVYNATGEYNLIFDASGGLGSLAQSNAWYYRSALLTSTPSIKMARSDEIGTMAICHSLGRRCSGEFQASKNAKDIHNMCHYARARSH